MKITAKLVWSLILVVLGIVVYVAAVSGALFGNPTGAGDVGLYSVTILFVAFGLLGIYVAVREQREQRESDES